MIAEEPRARRLSALAAVLRWTAPHAWFLEDEVAGLHHLVAPGHTCVDIGAEYGLYTYAFAHLAGAGGQVHSVEPLPGPRRFLRAALAALGARTVTLHATALSCVSGGGRMSLPVRGRLPVHGRAFLTDGADGLGPNVEFRAHRSVEVAVTTLDELAARHGLGRVDVIKADVEGAELAVLRGARGVLERDRPVLLLEVEERHLGKYGAGAADVVEHLAALGYAPQVWDGAAWSAVDGVTAAHRNYAFVTRGREEGGMADNVLGGGLEVCGTEPMTGWTRSGCCETGPDDTGSHTVCAVVTDAFLAFSAARGNDLTRPGPGFAGLVDGDRWCLCASRWKEALDGGAAPPVVLEGCHEKALEVVTLEELQAHAAG